ncbi:MAG: DUF6493 family protein [Bacteroidota bacterium]
MTEKFSSIITRQNEEELLSFLRDLTNEEKKLLAQPIKRLLKEYSQFGSLGGNSYGYINGTNEQRMLLQMAAFVCFNLADYEKTLYSVSLVNKDYLGKIIDWCSPGWLSDFINKQASSDFLPSYLNYDWIMELSGKGVLRPTKELIAKALTSIIYKQNDAKTWVLTYEKLLKETITLDEHVWYLFEAASDVHSSGRYLHFEEKNEMSEAGWIGVFKKISAAGDIDRSRLIKESLLAANRNFNKLLSGWFSQLFVELEPGKEEILDLQKELFSVLSSPHSKVVNTALQTMKTIAREKKFDASSFFDAVPLLLSSTTKATVLSTLAIVELLVQDYPAYSEKIQLMVCQCFIHLDETIQSKAAKFIAKNAHVENMTLRNEIAIFDMSLLTTPRQLLGAFTNNISESRDDNGHERALEESNPVPTNEIPFPASIDDLFFLASQAFDNNEPWHIDLLPAALVHFHPQITDETIQRFEPAFQRALGLLKKGGRSSNGHLDFLLAIFFIDYGNILIGAFPNGSESIKKVYRSYDTKNGENTASFLVSPNTGFYTKTWKMRDEIEAYLPYKLILSEALDKIAQGCNLPLLSTPTHEPCWIHRSTLIDRLSIYQQAGKEPGAMDLQVAISRCRLTDDVKVEEILAQKLTGEFRNILSFLLSGDTGPMGPFCNKAAWLVASVTRKEKRNWPEFESFPGYQKSIHIYTEPLQWHSIIENYRSEQYDHATKKYIKKPATRKISEVLRYAANGNEMKFDKKNARPFLGKGFTMLYECMSFQIQYYSVEHNDLKRIMALVPNNPEWVLADVFNHCLNYAEFWEESSRKAVVSVIQVLYEIWNWPGEMAKLFLGTCMLSADKTIINIAGELWLKAVAEKKINNAALGKIIGLHERIELMPLKRFTDLAMQRLFRNSPLHNKELQILVENVLPELPDEPIKNLKKLLELYRELLIINEASLASLEIQNRLKAWEKNAGLRNLVGQLGSAF